jgi:flagellar motor switch protein FliG
MANILRCAGRLFEIPAFEALPRTSSSSIMKLIPHKATHVIATLCALAATVSLVSAAEIDEVMKGAFKGDTSLYKNVATGKGTPADAEKLLGQIKDLKGTKAPKGEQKDYDDKVAKLIAAAEGVVAKSPDALKTLQTAGNCKACHSEHRE